MRAPNIQRNGLHPLLPSLVTVLLDFSEESIEPVPAALIAFQNRIR
jgi:hypothetical protein